MRLGLRKHNIIHLEAEVTELLKSGRSAFRFPIKLVYKTNSTASSPMPPYKVLFIVPKRYLKKAYQRNLIKRRIKEAFRVNQTLLISKLKSQTIVYLAFIYVSKDIASFKHIQESVVSLIGQIDSKVEKDFK